MRVDGLTKRLGRTRALRDCSFDLRSGTVSALVGANGAGKSTLLKVLAGLYRPDEGSAVSSGRVSFVAQEKPLYRSLTASDMFRALARLNRVWDVRRGHRWLSRFGVPADRACAKLSDGERTQVALALALAAVPSVLLLDEPLASLDPLVRREVTAELLTEVADSGTTVVMSTHGVTELDGVADHLLLLAGGRLLARGEIDSLLRQHIRYVGPRSDTPPVGGEVVHARHEDDQSSFLVHAAEDVPGSPPAGWLARPVPLDDLVLAHLAASRTAEVPA
ncbi:ABC transporter [Amycolatopsis antarctica]|uniref:ABC transporter n=1 Tax=Amycolatopsis antarctica TaxID=1854586 RepID=A0A263CW02_9PSEU|nr:ABC transporter [Amycolatopsis antarctica]